MKKLFNQFLFPFCLLLFCNVFSANSKVEIFGSAIENKLIELQTTDGIVYSIKNQSIIPGEIMFGQDESIAWGSKSFPTGSAVANSFNFILIPTGGKYDITFNLSNGKYDFKLVGEADPSIIQLNGSAIKYGSDDVLMNTEDNENYFLKNQPLERGYLNFKLVTKNNIYWGASQFPSGTAVLNGYQLIEIEQGGYYDVTFNKATGDYTFKLIEVFPDKIGIYGSAVDDYTEIVELTTKDGIVYTLNNKLLTTGNLSFVKVDDYFGQYWGGKTFPKGVIDPETSEIDVLIGGIYNITFNKETLSYNFELVGEPLKSIITLDQYGPEYSKFELTTQDGIIYSLKNTVIKKGNYVFTQDNKWQWASRQFPKGIAEFKTYDDIEVNVAGAYNITFNLKTGEYNFELIGTPFYDTIRLTGSSLAGYTNNQVDFSTLDGEIYTLKNQKIKEGNLQFLNDEYFTYNSWSAKDFPKGVAKSFGEQIDVYIGGNFDITFNKRTLEYEFKLIGNPTVTDLVIRNYDTVSTFTTKLNSTDGIVYTLDNHPFYVGEVSMLQKQEWNWGFENFPKGKAAFDSYNNAEIVNSGRYNFTFNILTKEYSFELIELFKPLVGIIGDAVNSWTEDVFMSSNDGIIYVLKDQFLTKGEIRFRQERSWDFNWASQDFPKGVATTFGVGIPISTEGYYDITFNLKTKEYEFKLVKIATIPVIKIAGYAILSDNTTLETTDGINYSLSNVLLTIGHLRFTDESGNYKGEPVALPSGVLGYNELNELNINERGIYNIIFNRLTEEYTIEKVADLNQVIYAYGSSMDVAKLMNTKDGVIYTLKEQKLNKGSLVFQNDDIDVMVFWSSKDFPVGKVQKYFVGVEPEDMIQVNQSGYYNIALNIGNNTMSFEETTLSTTNFEETTNFSVYPNPVTDGKLYLSEESNISLFDLSGRLILQEVQVNSIDVSTLSQGQYILKTDDGKTAKVMVK